MDAVVMLYYLFISIVLKCYVLYYKTCFSNTNGMQTSVGVMSDTKLSLGMFCLVG